MAIEYLGLSSINGPLVVLEGVENAFYDEIVEFIVDHDTRKMGRIVELDEDKASRELLPGLWLGTPLRGGQRSRRNASEDGRHGGLGHP